MNICCNVLNANFAIVLFSIDDMSGRVRDIKEFEKGNLRNSLGMRARQNVVYEMGYYM